MIAFIYRNPFLSATIALIVWSHALDIYLNLTN